MRLKTISIFLIIAFAVFTAFYWVTDTTRRSEVYASEQQELVEFGKIVFSYDPEAKELRAAGCARCHGPEGLGGPIPNDPNGRVAPNLHSQTLAAKWLYTGGNVDPEKTDLDNYVYWVIQYGGVMVSGDIKSPMPAWRQTLTKQQMQALTALIGEWLRETVSNPAPSGTPIPDTVEAGAQVYKDAGCVACHGADLAGVPGVYPSLQTIGSELVTDLPVIPSHLDNMQTDYNADKSLFLGKWILDGAKNYNDGNPIGGMPPFQGVLSDDQLKALITYLLDQT
jgi:mono/diheme cytochrome c family protein